MAAKKTGKGGYGRSGASSLRSMKFFRPVSWYDRSYFKERGEFVSHILLELGRLGLRIEDVERHDRAPHTQTVLSDLLNWFCERPGGAFAKLFDWRTLDLSQIKSRLEKDRTAKPRVEISAHITKMNNLSVRWHPGGWKNSEFDWGRKDHHFSNLVTHRRWPVPPDFHWFEGDEDPTFDSRPSNELMYIRGVGNLRPEPHDDYGPYATYNRDVLHSILICAVRSAYEGLIRQLEENYDVEVVDSFDFVTRDEIDESDPSPYRSPIHRVVAWSIQDTAELQARRVREEEARRDKSDREELANVAVKFGFQLETFLYALSKASLKKPTGPLPSSENINRNAAKILRVAGFTVDARDVRRLRSLVERYNPEVLPEELVTLPKITDDIPPTDNVLRFPTS
jgi:hypothetical protein